MEKKIEVDADTTVSVTMVGIGKWRVAVGERLIEHEVRKLGSFQQDIHFRLPDGRRATVAVRPNAGSGVTFDAQVDDQFIIDPSKWPFTCPQCHAPVRPRDRSCTSCNASQPSAEERVMKRARRSASRGLWWNACIASFMLVMYVVAERRALTSALGSVNNTMQTNDVGRMPPGDRMLLLIVLTVTLIIVNASCALLARRLPATAHWVNTAFSVLAFVFYWAAAGMNIVWVIGAPILLWNMARAARYARNAQRLAFSS